MANIISQPTINGVSIPFPSSASIDSVTGTSDEMTLKGKTAREVCYRKYRYTLTWDYMIDSMYNRLEDEVNNLSSVIFKYEKWPQSETGVAVLPKLLKRELSLGVGDENFYSRVTLECLETESRI